MNSDTRDHHRSGRNLPLLDPRLRARMRHRSWSNPEDIDADAVLRALELVSKRRQKDQPAGLTGTGRSPNYDTPDPTDD